MKKLLGELLLENNEITQEQLEEALKFQKDNGGGLLGIILIDLGYLDGETLLEFLKIQGIRIKNT